MADENIVTKLSRLPFVPSNGTLGFDTDGKKKQALLRSSGLLAISDAAVSGTDRQGNQDGTYKVRMSELTAMLGYIAKAGEKAVSRNSRVNLKHSEYSVYTLASGISVNFHADLDDEQYVFCFVTGAAESAVYFTHGSEESVPCAYVGGKPEYEANTTYMATISFGTVAVTQLEAGEQPPEGIR